jgi:Mg-chelatase subunit ChlD
MNRLISVFPLLLATTSPATAERVSVLVFDASGSMWNRVEGGQTRIEVARDVMADYFGNRDRTVRLSVIAYGHNRRGDCTDIEVIAPLGTAAASTLETRLRALQPRGMTPLTDSLAKAREQIPPNAEAADIILVTDGLETCAGDPCALASGFAAEGIEIRAHVVGFGLSGAEVEALSCITEQTGGLLFRTESGAELAQALQAVSSAALDPEPAPAQAPQREAAFDIGDKAEAGFRYQIGWRGEARSLDYLGFVPKGENGAPTSGSFGPIGGASHTPNNPSTRTAPSQPGTYDLIIRSAGAGVIARQTVEVVAAAVGFDAIGSVEPGSRMRIVYRGPDRVGERIVIADPEQPVAEFQRHGWGFSVSARGSTTLKAPTQPGEYELRYLSAARTEVLFSRRFGVGIALEDAVQPSTSDLAAQAAAATRGDATQDRLVAVPATFRVPPNAPQSEVSWEALPLDADMAPEAWSPSATGPVISGEFEPGNWRVRAYAPGEVVLSADVAIFPGQRNDFVIPIATHGEQPPASARLSGRWGLYGVPPWGVDAGLERLLSFDLEHASASAPITGRWTATSLLGGPAVEGRSGALARGSYDGQDLLRLEFEVGAPIPEPFSLMLRPQGVGYSGGLRAGASGIRVLLWPIGQPLPLLDEVRPHLHGPDPRAGNAPGASGGTPGNR